jgi:hypothetical protein
MNGIDMTKIEYTVNGCDDCLFRHTEWDDYATHHDTTEICVLNYNHRLLHPESKEIFEYIITSYDGGVEEIEIETPQWCPLKINSISIKLEENGKTN